MKRSRGAFHLAGYLLVTMLAFPEYLAAQAAPGEQMSFAGRFAALRDNKEGLDDSTRLHRLFDLSWEYNMETYPEWGTWVGHSEGNDRWTDNSPEAIERRKQEQIRPLEVIERIDRSALTPADRLNYDLFRRDIQESIAGNAFRDEYMPITQLGGPQQGIPNMLAMMPQKSVADYENILARMEGVPTLLENTITLMEKGRALGITPPRVTLRDIPGQILSLLSEQPDQSPLLKAFTDMPESIPEEEASAMRRRAEELYRTALAPAYRKLHTYMVETYLPSARESIGMSALPEGEKWYAYQVRSYTTTERSPEEIFEIGKAEVKRIRAEMEKVIDETGFQGDFAAFTEFLRTDPQFFYADAESLLQGYRDICKRADPELVKLFGRLPRLPYGVRPVPAYSEKSQTTAYYMSGSLEAGRPGYFYANTYDLTSRPKWEMEALALHEAVPGHHLQISLAQEMEGMPEFRKEAGYTAFVEGWGLYAESLGDEMGFYQDPYAKFGRLTYEMWRAIRLVLDVGIHRMGWSREQAIDFFVENSGKSRHDIEVEVDRYIVWPGQALAYKIGELKIRQLRAEAERRLGDRFDIRAFHDHLLGAGALPLDVLEKRMKEWTAAQVNDSGMR